MTMKRTRGKKMVSTLLCKYGSSTLSKVSILGVVSLWGDCPQFGSVMNFTQLAT